MTILLGDTAAERRYPFGLKAAFSSLTKAANAGLSESGPFLQSTCQSKCLYTKNNYDVAFPNCYLPTFWIFPIQIKSIKVVLVYEFKDIFDKSLSGCRIIDQSGIFVSLRIVPSSNSNGYLSAFRLVSSNPLVEFCNMKMNLSIFSFLNETNLIKEKK